MPGPVPLKQACQHTQHRPHKDEAGVGVPPGQKSEEPQAQAVNGAGKAALQHGHNSNGHRDDIGHAAHQRETPKNPGGEEITDEKYDGVGDPEEHAAPTVCHSVSLLTPPRQSW